MGQVGDGEFFILLGPTGAGKTTTLRLIAGLEAPDSGSILIGGQAGLVLAGALIGWNTSQARAARLRAIAHDLMAIIGGAACLLVWAGLVESFVSQYHQPVLPYGLKIAFGLCEAVALAGFLGWAGRE